MKYLAVTAICMILALSPRAQQGNYSNESIEALNLEFRRLYAAARQRKVKDVEPVVIARGESLILLHRGQRTVGDTVHPNYNDLKTVAHVPLGVFCVLHGTEDGAELTADQKRQLAGFRARIVAVKDSLSEIFQQPPMRNRQSEMLASCTDFIDETVRSGRYSANATDNFIDSIRPDLLRNTEAATRLRIDNYHTQMKRWRSQMTDAEWRQLYVVIPGASMSRKNSTAVQYFAKLLQERGEGRRIIYAESQFDEEQDLSLLGTHLLDSEVGLAFFNDPWRMKRDLLSSAADSYLDSLDFDE